MAKKRNIINEFQVKCKETIQDLFDEVKDIKISIFDESTKEGTSNSDLAIKALTDTIPKLQRAHDNIQGKNEKTTEGIVKIPTLEDLAGGKGKHSFD